MQNNGHNQRKREVVVAEIMYFYHTYVLPHRKKNTVEKNQGHYRVRWQENVI